MINSNWLYNQVPMCLQLTQLMPAHFWIKAKGVLFKLSKC